MSTCTQSWHKAVSFGRHFPSCKTQRAEGLPELQACPRLMVGAGSIWIQIGPGCGGASERGAGTFAEAGGLRFATRRLRFRWPLADFPRELLQKVSIQSNFASRPAEKKAKNKPGETHRGPASRTALHVPGTSIFWTSSFMVWWTRDWCHGASHFADC